MYSLSCEEVIEEEQPLHSPVALGPDAFAFAALDGAVFRHTGGATAPLHHAHVPLTAFALHPSGAFFLADAANHCVRRCEPNAAPSPPLAAHYAGHAFLGPSALLLDATGDALYIADAGPWGASSLATPLGSLFRLALGRNTLTALAHRSLAHPAGLALAPARDRLYVCETLRNAVLRAELPVGALRVWRVFAGGVGPRAVAVAADGRVVVARGEVPRALSRSLP